ncbi:MAG: flagellar biosynthesis protein FlhB [Thermosediminibacterales bacterium]|nr:flagellar biosynthesis protein FlhB [Thermosediminibacterales bacterium]
MIDKNFVFNLQLFAEEKTEKPTPRRRQQAKEKGQVAKSRELNSALMLITVFAFLKFYSNDLFDKLVEFSKGVMFDFIGKENTFTLKGIYSLAVFVIQEFLLMVFPIAGMALVVGILANLLQTGLIFSSDSIAFKLERINPIEGLKRVFSKRSIVELIKSLIKITITGYITFLTFKKQFNSIFEIMDMDIQLSLKIIGNIIFKLAINIGVALMILSLFDYFYQWWEHEKNLRMTKQDIKEEYKQTEGNPQIKARIKQIQKQLAMRRMMQQVPKADVVITNPEHIAIALKYDEKVNEAPIVVAKGADFLAQKIKEIAIKNKITVIEDKPLAHSLYKTVDVGDVIPEELYKAVAEVLAYVYSLQDR